MTTFRDYLEIAWLFWPSLATAAALGFAASILGIFVLLRREALIAIAMPHTVAVGAAIGLRLGWQSMLPPALGAVLVAIGLLVWSRRRGADRWLLPAIYVGALCLSLLIVAHGAQHVEDIHKLFLGGTDVAVDERDARLSVPVLIIAGSLTGIFWRRWLLLAQAPAVAQVARVRTTRWETQFLCLLAVVLLLGTHDLSAVMVVALLFLPAATVLPWARTVPAAIASAITMALVLIAAGFVISVRWDLPLSQSVGGVGFIVLIVSHLAASARRA